MPSMARVCPITPPAYFEKSAQFVPNWNSIGIPVTTPMAKLSPKIFAQNRTALLYFSSPVRSAIHFPPDQEPGQPHRQAAERD